MRGPAILLPAALAALAGIPSPPAGAQEEGAGEALYRKYCAQCHGEEGDGEGIAAPFLSPRPRDFTAAKYKVRSTPTGALPTDEDLERAIRRGLPYTGMPAFPNLRKRELGELIAHLKSFSGDFEDPEAHAEPIEIPDPPPWSEASAEQGREVYVNTGCIRCHGEEGRGDGHSAPTLTDDLGRFIRAADLTKPWTFSGGPTLRDVYRTMSTGFNGTPMPGFEGAMSMEDRWYLVDYIASLSGNRTEAPYATFVRAVPTTAELDLADAETLFESAPPATFPLVGQVIEPGRSFHPGVDAVTVRAVYNPEEIAFHVTWHDMRAETSGSNSPDVQVPDLEDLEAPAETATEEDEETDEGGFWGDLEAGGGEEEKEEAEAASDLDAFFAPPQEEAAAETAPASELSDAVALQFPATLPEGVRKPYFLFGDPQNPVELWYLDLARPEEAQLWSGRGSGTVTPLEDEPPQVVAAFEAGEWTVLMKHRRRRGPTFEEGSFVPVAFSVWDGFNRERGKRRAISAWYDVYLEPFEKPSPLGPMTRAGLGILGAELLLLAFVRRRYGKRKGEGTE